MTMKTKLWLALAVAAVMMNGALNLTDSPRWTLLGGAAAHAGVRVDIGFFYNELAPYGYWQPYEPYGWVWYPNVEDGWQPYTIGHWVFTNEYGWIWVSSEPWGSIPFHYGRWFYDSNYGRWAWVPGTVWGPAWVSWRVGNGFIGWAPLPPTVEFEPGIGFSAPVRNYGISWHSWCFVPESRFLSPRLERIIVPRPRNVALLNNTEDVTHYAVVNERIINRGIDIGRLEQIAQTRVPRYRVAEVDRPVPGKMQMREGQVSLFRPQVIGGSVASLPPSSALAPTPGAPVENQARRLSPLAPLPGSSPADFHSRDRRIPPQIPGNEQRLGDGLRRGEQDSFSRPLQPVVTEQGGRPFPMEPVGRPGAIQPRATPERYGSPGMEPVGRPGAIQPRGTPERYGSPGMEPVGRPGAQPRGTPERYGSPGMEPVGRPTAIQPPSPGVPERIRPLNMEPANRPGVIQRSPSGAPGRLGSPVMTQDEPAGRPAAIQPQPQMVPMQQQSMEILPVR
jgi:hypothetical protein